MAVDTDIAASRSQPTSRRSWANTNSRQILKAYDNSSVGCPTHGPPMSRNNSTTSVNSLQSEPAWHSRRHQSEPFIRSPSENRKGSTASQLSTQSTASHKKGGFKSLFSHKDPAEKEKKKKEVQKIVLGSKHAAAVQTKMQLDPSYREFQQKHPHPHAKTAGINENHVSGHLQAADMEARHPHSGPPALYHSLDLPSLTRIESHDEPDDEIDPWEAERREWNQAKEHNLAYIPENKLAEASPETSPVGSRDMDTDLLARSLAERLETTA